MRKHFLIHSQIPLTFGNVEVDKTKLPEKYTELEFGNFPKNITNQQIDYIEKMGDALEQEYLKNGLFADEVEIRKKTYGPNALPEPKKTPKIILFLREISSIFALLLWFAAALSLLAFGLDAADFSNLY